MKGLFGVLEFAQKTNEFDVVVKTNSFVCFLGEFEDSPFEIIWPLNQGTHVAYKVDRNKIIAALSLNKTQKPKVAITQELLKPFFKALLGFKANVSQKILNCHSLRHSHKTKY